MRRCHCAVARSFMTAWLVAPQRRRFVDAPVGDPVGMEVPVAAGSPLDLGASAAPEANEYTYPLDGADTPFKLYGENQNYANDAANRIFASAKTQSYDPSVLYSDLRLQDPQAAAATGAEAEGLAAANAAVGPGGVNAPPAGMLAKGGEGENDAVMREGRDKQGAAGAAVVAAAMLETRRGADAGVPMVPGHPLPVVFPRPDGLPPPLRFIKKFGPGSASLARSRQRQRRQKDDSEDLDKLMYGEVMETDGKIEGHSIKRSIALQVRVLDEHRRLTKVRQFQHFREVSDALPERVLQALVTSHFTMPTLLQSAAIPQLMAGKDVIGVAPNGSGKTIAFCVPSLSVLVKVMSTGDPRPAVANGVSSPLVLVVCPTRETVQRTAAMYSSLIGEDVRVVSAYVSATERDAERQEQELKDGCDVLVVTPKRIHQLLEAGKVRLDCVHFLAVDEAEKIFDQGLEKELKEAMELVKQNKIPHQVSIWAASMSPEVEDLAAHYTAPVTATVIVRREEATNINVKQILYPLPSREERMNTIKKLYERRVILKREQVVVYCVYKETAEAVAKELATALSAPSSLVKFVHSGLRSRKRNQILQEFKQGDVRILVGTDVSTKRLDVPDLEHIINFDLPATTDVFARRVSGVGRAGRQGMAHTFLCPGDARVPMIARFVEQQTGRTLSAEINKMIEDVSEKGGEDDWSTPLIRFSDHAAAQSKWRVRGKRDRNYQHYATKELADDHESDEK